MTDVLSPVDSRDAPAGARQPSVVLAGVTAAIWAGAVGLIVITAVVLVAWSADGRSGSPAAAALRIAADAWLLANGTRLHVDGSPFGLIPLGLTALPAYLLCRAGASLARTVEVSETRGAARATAALAGAHGVLAVVVTGPATTAHVRPDPLWAFLAATVLAGAFGGLGVLRGADLWPAAWAALPEPVRLAVHGGALAVTVVLSGAAALAGGALAISAGEAGSVLAALRTGVVATLALLVVSLAYLPNATLWAAGFVAGPGFAVGTGTTVSSFGVHLQPVPALPLLAALPSTRIAWLVALLLLPMAGGLLAGAVVGRRHVGRRHDVRGLGALLATGAGTGVAAGLLMGLLC
ncbi:MAG: DUF6350 family protein, partial [Actinomycetota bacterium]|nr:DUF6350 family protein [Actinomycetota bacterium]